MKKKKLPRNVPPRMDRYMGLAFWVASFSKDPNTQVGALLIGSDNRPLGYGYNGPPRGIDDLAIDWARPQKYRWMVHAEENAIYNSVANVAGATLYVTAKPCTKCMLTLASHQIKEIIYFPYDPKDLNSTLVEAHDFTDEISSVSKINLIKFNGNLNWLRDRLNFMENQGIFT